MFALVRGQALRIPQPQRPAPIQFRLSVLLGAAHLLDRFVQQLHHMEAVDVISAAGNDSRAPLM